MLTLVSFAHPKGKCLVDVFTPEKAVDHVVKHVLQPPECHGWALILDAGLRPILEDTDDAPRYSLRREAERGKPDAVKGYYSAYAQAIEAAGREAVALGWRLLEAGTEHWLSTDGVLVILRRMQSGAMRVITSFLPGLGRVERDGERDRGMRRKSASGRARKAASWTDEQRLYHEVFRVALKHIRKQHADAYQQTERREWAHLKRLLPSNNQLDYETWLELRKRRTP